MPLINILSPHTADLIAAGEVVERPASVVKELVENAIDAGAQNIRIEITRGGMGLIRVTDDGRGMSPEDAGLAFLRHATSKIKDEKSLESISTLGFRGEALAAISAVSKIELRTRERGSAPGTEVELTAGEIDGMGPAGCPEGTSMTVNSLFYNTPARLKFMKSDRAEGSACLNAAMRCAMGHPEISMRMLRDGEELFFTPGDGSIKSVVYSLLGRDVAMSMLAVQGENEGVSVQGFVSAPHAGRGNRAMQFFFVNGRAFKSLLLQAAVENAYKNTLLTGRFPSCAIYLTLDFSKVDVNVHPTKQEVKFSEEKKAYDTVYYAVLSALGGKAGTAEIELSSSAGGAVEPKQDFFKGITGEAFRASRGGTEQGPFENLTLRQDAGGYGTSRIVEKSDLVSLSGIFAQPTLAGAPVKAPEIAPPSAEKSAARQEEREEPFAQEPYRLIGEAMATYIVIERGGELVLIDKHAAHERIIFDALQKQQGEIMSQTLLVPETFTPAPKISEVLFENAQELSRCGYEFDIYGTGSVVIRAVPADTDGTGAAALEEIAEKLMGNVETSLRDEILHTVACKAAIKAGKSSEADELLRVAEKVMSGEVRYCPHGRPVSITLTKKELDRQFMRIV